MNKRLKKKQQRKLQADYKRKPQQRVKYGKSYREKLYQKKIGIVEDNGVDITGYTKRDITRLRTSDDIDKILKIAWHTPVDIYGKKGESLYIAYCDYTTETSLEQIIALFHGKPAHQLLDLLVSITQTTPTYAKRGDSSSGKAGTAIFLCSKYADMMAEFARVGKFNRRVTNVFKKGKNRPGLNVYNHTGNYKGFQRLVDKNGNKTIKEITPYKVLVVANALLYHVTEQERAPLFYSIAAFCEDYIPQLYKKLPKTCK